MADATVHLMRTYSDEPIVNVGVGEDVTIRELAGLVSEAVGYRGRIVNDTTKPDGTPRKLLDVSRLNGLGWKAGIPLCEGIAGTYGWFLEHQADLRS
jgi:GDP-L-fucose synthase